jgi:hypothetical protein
VKEISLPWYCKFSFFFNHSFIINQLVYLFIIIKMMMMMIIITTTILNYHAFVFPQFNGFEINSIQVEIVVTSVLPFYVVRTSLRDN